MQIICFYSFSTCNDTGSSIFEKNEKKPKDSLVVDSKHPSLSLFQSF